MGRIHCCEQPVNDDAQGVKSKPRLQVLESTAFPSAHQMTAEVISSMKADEHVQVPDNLRCPQYLLEQICTWNYTMKPRHSYTCDFQTRRLHFACF